MTKLKMLDHIATAASQLTASAPDASGAILDYRAQLRDGKITRADFVATVERYLHAMTHHGRLALLVHLAREDGHLPPHDAHNMTALAAELVDLAPTKAA